MASIVALSTHIDFWLLKFQRMFSLLTETQSSVWIHSRICSEWYRKTTSSKWEENPSQIFSGFPLWVCSTYTKLELDGPKISNIFFNFDEFWKSILSCPSYKIKNRTEKMWLAINLRQRGQDPSQRLAKRSGSIYILPISRLIVGSHFLGFSSMCSGIIYMWPFLTPLASILNHVLFRMMGRQIDSCP